MNESQNNELELSETANETANEAVEEGNEALENDIIPESPVEEAQEIIVPEAKEEKKRSMVSSLYEYAETFSYALALMMILFLFVFRYVSVDGHSMESTLHDGDKLIISNMFYTPKTGDIVVINPDLPGEENEPIIKRVIATEGQTVFIDYQKWEVWVDGKKLNEPYIKEMHEWYKDNYGENVEMRPSENIKYRRTFKVGKGMMFVMGDNRNGSLDSRGKYGELSMHDVLGRVVLRISPDFGFVE